MTKTCKKCGKEKEISEFSPTSSYKGKKCYRCDCKECNAKNATAYYYANLDSRRAAARKWKAENPQKVVDNKRWNMYRLRPGVYEKILQSQNHKCPICSIELLFPHIDHCHTTGKVRGILCNTCNTGLGKFQDSVEQLQKAIRYLQKSSE